MPVWPSMIGTLATDDPVVVAPNPQWVADLEGNRWGFLASATLAVSVDSPQTDPLVVTLGLPSGDPAALHCSWDGQPVASDWLVRAPGRLTLSIPPDRLETGSHALSLVRTDQPVTEDGGVARLEVSELSWRLGDLGGPIEPRLVHRYHYIAAFLLQGVTGSSTTERLDGVLLIGPRSVRLPVGAGESGELRFTVQNSSPADATFTLRCGDRSAAAVVAKHRKAPLAIPLDDGARELELTVAGPPSGLFLWGAPRLIETTASPRTPIVLVTLDTTRRDVVPPYSGDDSLMPNLAEMARGATVYGRAVATSPWTLPSHASMLTGLYPSRHRAGVTDQELTADRLTAAELLRRHGWFTAGFAGGLFCSSRFGLSQGFAVYHDPAKTHVPGDQLTDLVLATLDDVSALHPLLFVNYFDPHFPYRAPDRLRVAQRADELGLEVDDGSIWGRILDGDGAAWTDAVVEDIPFPAQAMAALKAEYRAEVAFVDEQLGRLFHALEAHDLWDEALVIAVADHGELIGEHRLLGHGGRLDPELVEVPLIVKFPHQREPHTVDDLVSINDLFATMLEVAGVPHEHGDGRPLPRTSGASSLRQMVFSEEHAMGIHRLFGRLRIADHLYGLEQPARRQVVWEGGSECFERSEDGWQAGGCVSGSPMEIVSERLAPPRLLAGQHVGSISDVELERLRALGYAR